MIDTFDPFEHSPRMRLLRDAKPRTIIGMIAAGLSAVVASAVIGNRLGPLGAFHPIADAERLMQVGNPPASPPSFPLTRDVVSWYLIVMSAATLVIVRNQWRCISTTVPHLAQAGVLHWRGRVDGSKRWRAILVGSAHAHDAPSDFLSAALWRAQRILTAISRHWFAIFIVASAVAAGYINGEVNGSFHALSPTHLSAAQEQHWLREAGASWWAGPENLNGLFVYFLISALMFSAIAAQNGVGLAAIYIFVVMNKTFEFRCDWSNSDGYFGWSPVASLYRITLLSLTFHIAAITSVMWIMGWGRFAYMTVLIVIPVIAAPLYLLLPAIAFGRFSRREKERRIDELTAKARETTDLGEHQTLRSELDYVRGAKINPLRPRPREIPTSLATIVIPILLAVVQVIAVLKA
jgi:hypothetical protein